MSAALVQRLHAKAARLAERVLAEMYANPFWLERFGERGRNFAQQDGHYHLAYLTQALLASDAAVLRNYARWLRPVLTSRGMCTRHLAENFERLERAIAEEVEDSEAAQALLRSARAALAHEAGAPRDLVHNASSLAERALERLGAQDPAWGSGWNDRARQICRQDMDYHLSYLADAIALERPELFVAYVTWIDGFLLRRGVARGYLEQALTALADCVAVAEQLPGMTRAIARELLGLGLTALAAATAKEAVT